MESVSLTAEYRQALEAVKTVHDEMIADLPNHMKRDVSRQSEREWWENIQDRWGRIRDTVDMMVRLTDAVHLQTAIKKQNNG